VIGVITNKKEFSLMKYIPFHSSLRGLFGAWLIFGSLVGPNFAGSNAPAFDNIQLPARLDSSPSRGFAIENKDQAIRRLTKKIEALQRELAELSRGQQSPLQVAKLSPEVYSRHEHWISDFILKSIRVQIPHIEYKHVKESHAGPNMRSDDGGRSQIWEVTVSLRKKWDVWFPNDHTYRALIRVIYESGEPATHLPLELLDLRRTGRGAPVTYTY
jgi:hypothetical protein